MRLQNPTKARIKYPKIWHNSHLTFSPPPQFGGQVLEGGDTFPLSSVGFLVAEVTGYFYADITAVEHLSEDCTVGYVPQIDR